MTGTPDDPHSSWDHGALSMAGLSRVRLDTLLQELLGRIDEAMTTQERLRGLLDAVVGIGSDLDLNSTLERIVTAACDLVGARYGALGVLRSDGKRLARFITHGIPTETMAEIGPFPEGHGILGLLIDRPEPIRLGDLSQHPRSYGFPANHPPMKTFLGVPVRTGDRIFGNLYLTEKTGGGEFTADDERTALALAAAAGILIDNARLYADTERRRRWYEATAEITQFMLGEFDAQEGLDLVVRKAREVSQSRVGAILLTVEDELVVTALDGPTDFAHYLGRPISDDLPSFTDLLADGQRIVVEDLAELVKESGRLSQFPELESLGRTIMVPLPKGSEHSGGALVVAAAAGAVLGVTPGTDLLEMFANQTTLALDRAQARHDQAMLAILADRDRIARDLHDLVIQRLFATGLQLQGMQRTLDGPAQARIARAVEDLDATIHDLRSAIFELHRQDGGSLRQSITAIVDEYVEALGFRPRLVTSGPVDTVVPDHVRPQLLAALREALSNVVRHAQASHVEVGVTATGQEASLRIADDGVGIGIGATNRRSGLRNLSDRAATVDGTLDLRSNDPHGTVLELRFPV
ncbi:MAG TPA: GAF domain-containing sensor histidine kinase [Kribbella sp.]|nr:GAF domain-containing sensor histidine kinase [Kribbella sp.]